MFSIRTLFSSITNILAVFILLLTFIALVMFGEHNSQTQISILQKHRSEIKSISNIQAEDSALGMIEFQSIGVELTHNLTVYHETFDAFDPLVFLSSSDSDIENFEIFRNMTLEYLASATTYIKDQSSQENKKLYDESYTMLSNMIVDMLSERITAEHKQFLIREITIYASIIFGLIFLFLIHKKLQIVLYDIESLYGISSKNTVYKVQTTEVESILLKFNKSSSSDVDNPAYLDSLTKLKNFQGLIHVFNTSKILQKHNAITICMFEIDNYAILKRKYDKEFIDSVHKKIAFILSLHEQPSDIIAHFEESKFILVLGRDSKTEALKECEKMRQSIAETFFKVPKGAKITITLSGGFIMKPANKTINASIEHTRDILKKAQEKGTNHIAQLRDFAEKF
jgi:diguanylate cyclase (GGDEF)-like protein